jgi:glutathione S-transferase
MSDWMDVEKARTQPGLRLALTAGVPGPWSEAAKGVFNAKNIPYARVRQDGGQPNDALYEWTGHRNAPVAVFGNEAGRAGWVEILFLAERLAPEPALIPADPAERALMFGLAHELMGEDGFGWNRRLMLFRQWVGEGDEPPPAMEPVIGRMVRQYRYSRAASDAAAVRVAQILRLFSERIRAQRAKGNRYLMGPSLTALDIYWAAMAGMVEPLPAAQCPMQDFMRAGYTIADPQLRAACDPALMEHRDFVYERHIGLPTEL